MPLNEFSRDEIQKQIAEYESGLEKPGNMPQSHVLSLENEDTEFIEEVMRVRNNDDVPLAEDDVEATPDPYLHRNSPCQEVLTEPRELRSQEASYRR